MIRLRDAVTLAWTKLKLHKIRTGVAVGISGLVFGVLLAVVVAIQGTVNSIDNFSEGFNDRYLVEAHSYDGAQQNEIFLEIVNRPSFIEKVEKIYDARIAEMKKEANRLNIPFDSSIDEASPIDIDSSTKKKSIGEHNFAHWAVADSLLEEVKKLPRKTVLADKISKYDVKHIYPIAQAMWPGYSNITMYKSYSDIFDKNNSQGQFGEATKAKDLMIGVLDDRVLESFTTVSEELLAENEVPVVIPFSYAERLLGLKALGVQAEGEQRIERMREVDRRLKDLKIPFCYRNNSSRELIDMAKSIQEDIKQNGSKKDFVKPDVVYSLPSDEGCEQVKIIEDRRTQDQKRIDESLKSFRQKFNKHLIPLDKGVVFRVVGTVQDPMSQTGLSGVSQMIAMMSYSSLQFQWTVPSTALAKLPTTSASDTLGTEAFWKEVSQMSSEAKLIEFHNAEEAVRFIDREQCEFGNCYMSPFANSSIAVAQLNSMIRRIMPWIILVVSVIASLILAGIIGRTVADSRKETAVFRAIGASRGDISSIYITYTLLLALRIVVFALVLAIAIAFSLQLWLGPDATIGAKLSLGVIDDSKSFSFIGINDWYILIILSVIVASSLVAMVLPLLRNIRRNPINDMRDDG